MTGADVLSRREIALVLDKLTRQTRSSQGEGTHAHQRMIIFRLTIGAGLRVSEIAALNIEDVIVAGDRPHIRVRARTAKRRKARMVPIWWDCGTWDALAYWLRVRREEMLAGETDPLVCVLVDKLNTSRVVFPPKRERSVPGARLTRPSIYAKWMTAVRCLGKQRCRQIHPHSGRHTFASYMLAERSLPEVRDALGHSSAAITSLYLHTLPEDLDRRGNVFRGAPPPPPPPERPKPLPPPDLRSALPIDRLLAEYAKREKREKKRKP